MNVWRWCGAFLFLMGVFSFVASPRLVGPVSAQEKKDDKGKDEKKDDTKKDEAKKDEAKKDEKKAETKAETKTEAKKDDAAQGSVLKLTAFDADAKPFFQELKTNTTQTMKVMGQEIVQKQDQTFVVEWIPKAKDKDGNYVVTQKIVGIKMNIDIGGNKISFDSTQKNQKNPMTDFFEQLLKQELEFHISPDLSVKEIKGRDEFVKSLGETNPQMTALLKQILSQDALTKMAEPTWWALPTGPVTKDKTWTKDSKLNLGPIGKYDTSFTFTYLGQDKNLDKVGIKADLTYSAPTEKEASGLPFTIKEAKLASKKPATGEALFDRSKGRFESSKMNMELGGTLTITVGNMNTDISLDQVQESVSKSTDTNPWGGAAAPAEKTEKK
jgi:hypothetical protein